MKTQKQKKAGEDKRSKSKTRRKKRKKEAQVPEEIVWKVNKDCSAFSSDLQCNGCGYLVVALYIDLFLFLYWNIYMTTKPHVHWLLGFSGE